MYESKALNLEMIGDDSIYDIIQERDYLARFFNITRKCKNCHHEMKLHLIFRSTFMSLSYSILMFEKARASKGKNFAAGDELIR